MCASKCASRVSGSRPAQGGALNFRKARLFILHSNGARYASRTVRNFAMRALLFVAVAASSLFAAQAHAQRQAPSDMWCRDERIGSRPFDTVMICQAYTYQQCMASRTGFGTCYQNPRYDARFAKPKR
jgi:hypothetical protein